MAARRQAVAPAPSDAAVPAIASASYAAAAAVAPIPNTIAPSSYAAAATVAPVSYAAAAGSVVASSAVAPAPSSVAVAIDPPKRRRGRPRKEEGDEEEEGGSAHNWRDAEVVTLLQSKSRHQALFLDAKDKNKLSEAWEAVVLDINTAHGTNISSAQVRSKFQRNRKEVRALQTDDRQRTGNMKSKPKPSYWEDAISYFCEREGEGNQCFGQDPAWASRPRQENDGSEGELEDNERAAERRRSLGGISTDRDTCSSVPRSDASSSVATARRGLTAQSAALTALGNSMQACMGKLGSSLEVMGGQMKEGLTAMGANVAAGLTGGRTAEKGLRP
ncbi:hypothetical protein HK101_009407 [Irineochytrium annulatum]|nr:hypothetical protein HK101_009407 [Irineochytrium annulatum]